MSAGPRTFGKYELVQRIARGGMAEIFLAAQPGPAAFERFLVIKRILPAFTGNEEFVRMFLDEMRLAARLAHPNIGHIYDFGEIDGLYFIAMELIDGVNLRQLILRGHPLPLEHVVRIIGYVCEALHYAHTLNDRAGSSLDIVHRDVTPQNVMVSFEGGVKLVDFGIAKATIRAEQTQAGVLKGKFSYMSPEQIRGRPLDARADVFSVGVLLYELVTGARLFMGDTATDTMDAVTRCQLPRMSTIRASLPSGLEHVVERAVVVAPEDRYGSAREMQLELEQVMLDGRLVSNSILISEYLHAAFPERRVEPRGGTVTSLDDGQTLDDGSPPVLPQGWDTDLRTQLAAPTARPDAPPATVPRPGPGGAPTLLLGARWFWWAAAVVVAIVVFTVTTMVVSSGRQRRPIAATPSTGSAPLRSLPLPPPAGPKPSVQHPPRPAEREAPATVVLAERPDGCEVLVDGEPIVAGARDLAAGRHMLTTRGPGCQAETVELVLAAGDVRTIVPRSTAGGIAAPASKKTAASTVGDVPGADGQLDLSTRPWAKVYDGGRFLGVSPLSGVRLPAGQRTLRLVSPTAGTRRLPVTIRPGRRTRVSIDMTRLR